MVGVTPAQAVRRIYKYGIELSLGGQIPQTFEAGPSQHGTGIAIVPENPFFRNDPAIGARLFPQRFNLAGDGSFLSLSIR